MPLLNKEQQLTNQPPVTITQAKMRSFTMQHLDQGKMTSLPYRTSSPT